MFHSLVSHEEAKYRAEEDIPNFGIKIQSAFHEGRGEILVSRVSGSFLDSDDPHPFLTYLETLCRFFRGCYWKLEEVNDETLVSLVWTRIDQ
jgi:hypothetical protein